METLSSSTESFTPILEEFKENPNAPFETVKKGEKTKEYPYPFENKLKTNWSTTCEFMGWKQGNGENLDWNFFKVANDPYQVVKDIQNKVIKRGGALPEYGVDGKFGMETLKALKEASAKNQQSDIKKTEALKPLSSIEKRERSKEQFIRMIKITPQVEARLEKAGLKIDKNWLRNLNLSDADIAEYQTRSWKFREDVVTADPRLKPLNDLLQEILPEIEREVTEMDLSKINDINSLFTAMEGMAKSLEEKEKIYKSKIDEKLLEEMMNEEGGMENLMSLFGSFTNEMAILIAQPFLKDPVNTERIREILRKEFLIPRETQNTTIKISDVSPES